MGKTEAVCDCGCVHTSEVKKAKEDMLGEGELLFIADFYKALSDSTRIKIINLLAGNELCVCDIAYVLNMTKSAVSHQLKYLREMNVIKNRKSGKEVFYTLADDHVRQIFDISIEHMEEIYEN